MQHDKNRGGVSAPSVDVGSAMAADDYLTVGRSGLETSYV